VINFEMNSGVIESKFVTVQPIDGGSVQKMVSLVFEHCLSRVIEW
jgi:hypothetical protein